MKIFVAVKPNSKIDKVEKVDEGNFIVRVNAPAQEGKANKKLVELLAEYFKTAKSNVKIKVGEKTKNKIVEISL